MTFQTLSCLLLAHEGDSKPKHVPFFSSTPHLPCPSLLPCLGGHWSNWQQKHHRNPEATAAELTVTTARRKTLNKIEYPGAVLVTTLIFISGSDHMLGKNYWCWLKTKHTVFLFFVLFCFFLQLLFFKDARINLLLPYSKRKYFQASRLVITALWVMDFW